jgi:hypothetical protein
MQMAVEFLVRLLLAWLLNGPRISDQSSSNDFDHFDLQNSAAKGWTILHGVFSAAPVSGCPRPFS